MKGEALLNGGEVSFTYTKGEAFLSGGEVSVMSEGFVFGCVINNVILH